MKQQVPGERERRAGRLGCRAAAFTSTFFALSLACASAQANGRFPRAQRLIEDPSDANHLLLVATFGLLSTHDRGVHWYHTCENAFSSGAPSGNDTLVEIVAGGALLADVQSFIGRSPDGCSWAPAIGSGADTTRLFEDFAVDPGTRKIVVASQSSQVDAQWTIGLQRSDDAGLTFRAIGARLPAAQLFSIDLDPTDATHIYATGLSDTLTAIFLTSIDNGITWVTTAVPTAGFPYIASVNPHNPDALFVRVDSWVRPDGSYDYMGDDALLYTSDRGVTWRTVLHKSAKLLGFALSPDGTRALAGYGDPVDAAGYVVDPAVTGIYEASTSDLQFTRTSSDSVTCLTWTRKGVYACLAAPASSSSGATLALYSESASTFDAGRPQTIMRFADILGPPPCCAAIAAACNWNDVCQTFDNCGDGAAPSLSATCTPDASTSDAELAADAPDTLDSAANGGAFTDVVPPIASEGGAGAARDTRSGCACQMPSQLASWWQPGAGAWLLGVAALRRKRRLVRG